MAFPPTIFDFAGDHEKLFPSDRPRSCSCFNLSSLLNPRRLYFTIDAIGLSLPETKKRAVQTSEQHV